MDDRSGSYRFMASGFNIQCNSGRIYSRPSGYRSDSDSGTPDQKEISF